VVLRRRDWPIHAVMVPACVLFLAPFVWLTLTAFKSRQDVFSLTPRWLPTKWVLTNFTEAWQALPFGALYINTFLISFGLLAVQFVTVSLAAYAFARMEFPGRDFLFMVLLGQLMIAPQSTVVPNYLTVSRLGLLDTRTAIALPYVASAFGTFLLRQAFKTVPRELEEAAAVDGCTGLNFLWRMLVPLSRPSYLAFGLVSVTYHWNEFFWPLIVTDTARSRPLTVGLGVFAQTAEGGAEWTLLMAATLIAVGPIILLFLVLQRKFISSFMMSGLKG